VELKHKRTAYKKRYLECMQNKYFRLSRRLMIKKDSLVKRTT